MLDIDTHILGLQSYIHFEMPAVKSLFALRQLWYENLF